MTPAQQAVRVEVRFAAKLRNTFSDFIRMFLFFRRMLLKLFGDRLGMNPRRHKVVSLIAQYADNLRRERLIQQLDDRFAIRPVPLSYGALLHMLPRPLTNLLYIRQK